MNRSTPLDRVAVDALADRIAELATHIDAATHRLLTYIREFDDMEGWHAQYAQSCAHWLSWRIGVGLGASREKVRVARALGKLPAVDESFRLGELSYSKIRAITRVANADNEETLVNMGKHSTASELEKICRFYRRARDQESDDPAEPPPPERWLRRRDTDDGMVRIEIQLPPEQAARVLEACRVSAEDQAAVSGSTSSPGTDRVDGIVAMAELTLRGDKPERPPVEVLVHIDASTLDGNLEDGCGLSAETSARLLCDAGIVPILDDSSGQTLDVGRKRRTIPAALRRALRIRTAGVCQFPGCHNRRYVEAHHLVHWAVGGETKLANLIDVCTFHHRALHEGGVRVEHTESGDAFVFYEPDGRRIAPEGRRPRLRGNACDSIRAQNTQAGVAITSETGLAEWDGVPIQYDACVSALLPLVGTDHSRQN